MYYPKEGYTRLVIVRVIKTLLSLYIVTTPREYGTNVYWVCSRTSRTEYDLKPKHHSILFTASVYNDKLNETCIDATLKYSNILRSFIIDNCVFGYHSGLAIKHVNVGTIKGALIVPVIRVPCQAPIYVLRG